MPLQIQSKKNHQNQHGFKTTLYSIQQSRTIHTMIFKARVKCFLKHSVLLSSTQFLKPSIRSNFVYISWTEPPVTSHCLWSVFLWFIINLMHKFQLTPIKLSHGAPERKREKQFCSLSSAEERCRAPHGNAGLQKLKSEHLTV